MTDSNLIIFGTGAGDVDALLAGTGLAGTVAATADGVRAALLEHWAVALVVLDLRVADAALMERLQAPGAPPSLFLVATGAEGIAMVPGVRTYLDADAPAAELRAAILAALETSPPAGVADFSDRDSARLNALGGEIERIARALADLASTSRADTGEVTPTFVRDIIKRRRDRERWFPAELFSDPAWDMLLDLTAARLEGRRVSVSSLCIAAAVPTTTALRWIRNMIELGLFARHDDPEDMRRGLITLTDPTAERMLSYLASIRAAPRA